MESQARRECKSHLTHMDNNKIKNGKEPIYIGVITMERVIQTLKEIRITNRQETVIDKLIAVGLDMDFETLNPFLPVLSNDEVIGRTSKKILSQFKAAQQDNAFGSVWNEWCTKIAANELNITHKDLTAVLQNSQQLREKQKKVAQQLETEFKKALSQELPEEFKRTIQIETWITSQVKEVTAIFEKTELSMEEKEKSILETLISLIRIVNFSKGQKINVKQLRDQIINAKISGQEINLVGLHCLSFKNNPTLGIKVNPDARDFISENRDSSKVLITQNDSLDKVSEFCEILRDGKVKFKLTILVIDNDAFASESERGNVDLFCVSLKKVVANHPIAKHKFEIIKASKIMNSNNLTEEWLKINEESRKILIEEEFEKLNRRTLPPNMQTHQCAEEIARKNFLVQISMGSIIPILFPNSITLQRAKAAQQATQLFNTGNKIAKQNSIILTHWKNMTVIE